MPGPHSLVLIHGGESDAQVYAFWKRSSNWLQHTGNTWFYTMVLNDLEHSGQYAGPLAVVMFKSCPIQKRKHFSNNEQNKLRAKHCVSILSD